MPSFHSNSLLARSSLMLGSSLLAVVSCTIDVKTRARCDHDSHCASDQVCRDSVCQPATIRASTGEEREEDQEGEEEVADAVADASSSFAPVYRPGSFGSDGGWPSSTWMPGVAPRGNDTVHTSAPLSESPIAPVGIRGDASVDAGDAKAESDATARGETGGDVAEASVGAGDSVPACHCALPEVRAAWRLPEQAGGYYNVDQSFELAAGGESFSFAEEIAFVGGDARAIALGVESDGALPGGGRGEVAYFSMRGATAFEGEHCESEGGSDSVTTCKIPFELASGRTYKLRIWRLEDVNSEYWYWGAWIGDVQRDVDRDGKFQGKAIGALRGPAKRQALGAAESVVRYEPQGDACSGRPDLRVRAVPPSVDGNGERTATLREPPLANGCSLAGVRTHQGELDVTFGP